LIVFAAIFTSVKFGLSYLGCSDGFLTTSTQLPHNESNLDAILQALQTPPLQKGKDWLGKIPPSASGEADAWKHSISFVGWDNYLSKVQLPIIRTSEDFTKLPKNIQDLWNVLSSKIPEEIQDFLDPRLEEWVWCQEIVLFHQSYPWTKKKDTPCSSVASSGLPTN